MTTITFSHDLWFENVELRPHPWPGLAWITAMLTVPDVSKAQKFYADLFGLVCIFTNIDTDGTTIFARLRYRGYNLLLTQEGRFNLKTKAPVTTQSMTPFVIYLYVDDVETAYTKAIQAGCKCVTEPQIEPWGDRIARIEDPFGYIWELAMRISE